MALRFDGNGVATGGPITLTGDFRVDLPKFTLDSIGSVQILLGSINGKGWIAVNASGQLFFSGQQTNQLTVPNTFFAAGVEYSGVYLERVGTTLTVGSTQNGESRVVQDTGDWNISMWGGYGDNANFREPWLATGQGVISGDGITTTTHNFDATTGTTLDDTTGAQDWPLTGFTTGGFEAPSSGTASFTSQPDEFQVYPRLSFSDGIFSKGQAQVSFTATGTGALTYRLVNEDEVTEVIAAQPFTSGVQVTFNVPADAQWYKIELISDGVGVAFSNRFGVGGATYLSGQSLAVRMMKKAVDTTTLATLGITPTTLHSSFVSYTDSSVTNVNASWRQFSDTSEVDSAFVEYLNRKVSEESVVWALVGHARGGQTIDKFDTGGSERAQMQTAINEVGACHEFIWFQGHSDASIGTTYADYKSRLQSIFDWLQSQSSTSFETYTLAISNKDSANFGSVEQASEIRRAHFDFCNENSAKFINAYDIELVADGVHQSQQGSLSLARNITREAAGLNYGARFSSFTRNGANITVSFALSSGATTLVSTGSPSNVVSVSLASNPYAFLPTSSVTVGASSIDITLSSDPGTDDLLVWFGSTITNDGADAIRDDYTADGFSVGRSIARSIDYAAPNMIYLATAESNQPPTANAGANQSVAAGVTVTLDGTGSSDSDGTIASYAWTQTAGDTVTLTGANTATPSFTSPSTNAQQTLTFQLTVTDDDGATATDTVNVVVAAQVVGPTTSTLNATLTGIPDGTYLTRVIDTDNDAVLFKANQTWASGVATFTLSVAAGTNVEYYAYETVNNGAGLQTGVTE